MPETIIQWLEERGLTKRVIESNNLSWDAVHQRLVIPIFDESGTFLFNKYRRSPFTQEGPKYIYDKGSKVALYGAQHRLPEPVFICEGELDALRLQAEGLSAVSTTGGSGSFPEDSLERLEKVGKTFIVYDADQAGYRGAWALNQKLPHAYTVILPPDTKDVTDFLSINTFEEFEALLPEAVCLAVDENNERQLKTARSNWRAICDQKFLDDEPYVAEKTFVEIINRILGRKKQQEKYRARKNILDGNPDVFKIPISNFIEFNHRGYANCLWHQEKTPSMRFYPEDNHVHCFGCNATKNVVQVYMSITQQNFKDAFTELKEKYCHDPR